jgi:hypothetical protein
MEQKRFCRFCKCMLALSHFSKTTQKTKRRICVAHMRTVYRLRHTVVGGGSIAVEHFRLLKNAYQVSARDARTSFGGVKPRLRIQDLAPLITSPGQFCMPRDPAQPLAEDNVCVLGSLEHRRTLLRLWETTRDTTLYAAALRCFVI